MNERAAQMILLARAFEEVDREGIVLSAEQRVAATRRAVIVTTRDGGDGEFSRDVLVPSEETILRRARLIHSALVRRVPAIERVLEFARLRSLMGPVAIVTALLVGAATNALGPHRQINLLALPLLGLLAWNLAIYIGSLALCIARKCVLRRGTNDAATPASGPRDRLVRGLADRVVRFALWRSHAGWQKSARASERELHVTGRAFIRFSALWHRLTGRLLEARVRRRLHLVSAALVAGVIAGMYFRGIAFEYRATWESTLFSAPQVQSILNFVLAPAAWLLGVNVPAVAPLKAPGDGAAASWIHLYAMTALLVVGIPRLTLAAIELWRGRRIKSSLALDLEDAYFRRLLADWRGSAKRVTVLPYSFRPGAPLLDILKTLFHDFFGARARVTVSDPLEYGAGADEQTVPFDDGARSTDDRYVVVLFSLAQSPESEVQGQFLESLKTRLEPLRGRLLVLVDSSTYETTPERRQERMRSWARVAGETGLTAVEIDPRSASNDHHVADGRMAAFRAAMWTGADLVDAG